MAYVGKGAIAGVLERRSVLRDACTTGVPSVLKSSLFVCQCTAG